MPADGDRHRDHQPDRAYLHRHDQQRGRPQSLTESSASATVDDTGSLTLSATFTLAKSSAIWLAL